ncbi:MAG: YicC/YloC family endoribonuclease [Treponema sp.]|nr:YicC/YloC family endoribonuclease [Treponema sp.]
MNSMTGYGYEELVEEKLFLSVEIKSYNSRFLDLSINLPSSLSRLENFFREKMTAAVVRGKVDVYIRFREEDPATTVLVNQEAVRSYAAAISQVSQILSEMQGVAGSQAASTVQSPLELILSQEGVLVSHREFDLDSYKALLEPVFDKALEEFVADRRREGENLKVDLQEKLGVLEEAAAFFTQWQPQMENAFKENLQRRFQELLGEGYDQQRVLTEVAALLVKYTINEEIVRLKSHLSALAKELVDNATPGRKIDFICQEINREINTIGSKNQFTEVGAMVITAKDALENIREQARNVE